MGTDLVKILVENFYEISFYKVLYFGFIPYVTYFVSFLYLFSSPMTRSELFGDSGNAFDVIALLISTIGATYFFGIECVQIIVKRLEYV